jgi:hypothetical protein
MVLHLICWLYAMLLFLYPRSFRAQFGDEMQQVFAQVLVEAAQHGPVAWLIPI